MVVTTVAAAVCPLLLLVPRDATALSMALLIGAELLCGFSVLVFNVNTVTLRQTITPNRLLGRMNASYRLVLFGTGPIGAVLGGLLGASVGLRPAMVITVILLTTPALWAFFSPVFRLKEMPSGPPEDAGTDQVLPRNGHES
jgi:MFS family permease